MFNHRIVHCLQENHLFHFMTAQKKYILFFVSAYTNSGDTYGRISDIGFGTFYFTHRNYETSIKPKNKLTGIDSCKKRMPSWAFFLCYTSNSLKIYEARLAYCTFPLRINGWVVPLETKDVSTSMTPSLNVIITGSSIVESIGTFILIF